MTSQLPERITAAELAAIRERSGSIEQETLEEPDQEDPENA